MKKKRSFARIHFFTMMLAVACPVIVLSGLYLYQQLHFSCQDIEKVRNSLYQARKEELRSQVQEAFNFIEFSKSRQEEAMKRLVGDRVEEAHEIAVHLSQVYGDGFDLNEKRRLVCEALRPIRYLSGKGYFFATAMDGVELLFADRPEIEGRNLLELSDPRGNFVIRDMIALVKKQGQGFYRYYWTKPGLKGRDFPKISFVKFCQPLDCLLGSGVYLDDLEDDLRREVVAWINERRLPRDGYLFSGDYSGNILAGPARGKNVIDIKDADGNPVIRQLIEIARQGDGYLVYRMPEITGRPPLRKISYIKGLPEWHWYIGAGVYVDDIEAEIVQLQQRKQTQIWQQLLWTGGVLVALLLAAVLVSFLVWYRARNSFAVFRGFFEKASSLTVDVEVDKLDYNEFVELAKAANAMLAALRRSEKKRLEMEGRMRQSQKMEAIGTLAGGIAHDFNNVLAIIIGNIEILQLHLKDADPAVREHLVNVHTAAGRAAKLVRQILTFSRQREVERNPVQPRLIIKETLKLLKSSLPVNIIFQEDLFSEAYVLADPTQLHQMVINLCSNAAQAMPDGGRLTVSLQDEELSQERAEQEQTSLPPGRYLCLRVADTGTGISDEVRERVFEPFFTTKGEGEGTGMGLAVVHGIVTKYGGRITVSSTLGEGSSFAVWLPVVAVNQAAISLAAKDIRPGAGHIMLVEDEEMLLEMQATSLSEIGYRVAPFHDPYEALEVFRKNRADFDLLLTDLSMPGISGLELASLVKELRPSLPIIIFTGFCDQATERKIEMLGLRVLMKPLTREALAIALRQALEDKPRL